MTARALVAAVRGSGPCARHLLPSRAAPPADQNRGERDSDRRDDREALTGPPGIRAPISVPHQARYTTTTTPRTAKRQQRYRGGSRHPAPIRRSCLLQLWTWPILHLRSAVLTVTVMPRSSPAHSETPWWERCHCQIREPSLDGTVPPSLGALTLPRLAGAPTRTSRALARRRACHDLDWNRGPRARSRVPRRSGAAAGRRVVRPQR